MTRWSFFVAALALCGPWAQPRAGEGPATPAESLSVAAAGERCGSVVIRHCRLRPAPPSLVVNPQALPVGSPAAKWEAVRSADPENEEIVVSGEAIREADVRTVFDRNLGPTEPTAMVTRDAIGGARCTTLLRSGATLCSTGGSMVPSGLSVPRGWGDWTF